jgi:head-tail adaptor
MPDHSARDLREQIEILVQSKAVDSGGGKAITYVSTDPPMRLRAKVYATSASEPRYGDQIISSERLEVVIRYRSGINQTMRVKWGTRTFDIVGIRQTSSNPPFLELSCEERLGE